MLICEWRSDFLKMFDAAQPSPTRGLKGAAAADAGAGQPDVAQRRLVPKVGAGRSVMPPRHPRTTPKCILEVFPRFGHFGKNNEAAGRRRPGPKRGSNRAAAGNTGARRRKVCCRPRHRRWRQAGCLHSRTTPERPQKRNWVRGSFGKGEILMVVLS